MSIVRCAHCGSTGQFSPANVVCCAAQAAAKHLDDADYYLDRNMTDPQADLDAILLIDSLRRQVARETE